MSRFYPKLNRFRSSQAVCKIHLSQVINTCMTKSTKAEYDCATPVLNVRFYSPVFANESTFLSPICSDRMTRVEEQMRIDNNSQ